MLPSTLNSTSNLSKQLTQDLNHWKLPYIIFVRADAHHSISWAVISCSLLCIYGSNLHWILDLYWKIDLSELSAFMGASSRCFKVKSYDEGFFSPCLCLFQTLQQQCQMFVQVISLILVFHSRWHGVLSTVVPSIATCLGSRPQKRIAMMVSPSPGVFTTTTSVPSTLALSQLSPNARVAGHSWYCPSIMWVKHVQICD